MHSANQEDTSQSNLKKKKKKHFKALSLGLELRKDMKKKIKASGFCETYNLVGERKYPRWIYTEKKCQS